MTGVRIAAETFIVAKFADQRKRRGNRYEEEEEEEVRRGEKEE